MREIREEHRHLQEAQRLEAAQTEFIEASEALLAANRAARTGHNYLTNELEERAQALEIVEKKLKDAEAEFDKAIGEPKPVNVRGIVLKKLSQPNYRTKQSERLKQD